MVDDWEEFGKKIKPLAKKSRNKAIFKPQRKEIYIDNLPSSIKPKISAADDKIITKNKLIDVNKNTAKKFASGDIIIEARLDLHKKTLENAYESCRKFIKDSFYSKQRNLLIITGKGKDNQGLIKRELPGWLNDKNIKPYIVMFCDSQEKHGGEGAVYVLLKNKDR